MFLNFTFLFFFHLFFYFPFISFSIFSFLSSLPSSSITAHQPLLHIIYLFSCHHHPPRFTTSFSSRWWIQKYDVYHRRNHKMFAIPIHHHLYLSQPVTCFLSPFWIAAPPNFLSPLLHSPNFISQRCRSIFLCCNGNNVNDLFKKRILQTNLRFLENQFYKYQLNLNPEI